MENKEIIDILPDRKVETIEKYSRSCDTKKVKLAKLLQIHPRLKEAYELKA